jgi:hypothetical protein
MTSDTEPIRLGPEDELALRIGRVARAHVQIDNDLRRVHQSLVSPGLGVYLVNRITSTSVLVADCRAMIAKAALTPKIEAAAVATLDAVTTANATRNRVIHDMWLREPALDDAAPRWVGHRRAKGQLHFGPTDPPRDLAFLDAALIEMRRTSIRVAGLNWTLWDVLPFFEGGRPDGPDRGRDLLRWIAVLEDRFDLLDDGAFSPHDW